MTEQHKSRPDTREELIQIHKDYKSLLEFNAQVLRLLGETLTLAWGDMRSGEWLPTGRRKTVQDMLGLSWSKETKDDNLESLIDRCQNLRAWIPTQYVPGICIDTDTTAIFEAAKTYMKEKLRHIDHLSEARRSLEALDREKTQQILQLQHDATRLQNGHDLWHGQGRMAIRSNTELLKREDIVFNRLHQFAGSVELHRSDLILGIRDLMGGQPSTEIERNIRMYPFGGEMPPEKLSEIRATLGLGTRRDTVDALNHIITSVAALISSISRACLLIAYKIHRHLTDTSQGDVPAEVEPPHHNLNLLSTLIMHASTLMSSATSDRERLQSLDKEDMLGVPAWASQNKQVLESIEQALKDTQRYRQDPGLKAYQEEYTQWFESVCRNKVDQPDDC